MNTKTTQELARELADILYLRDTIDLSDLKDILKREGVRLPNHIYSAVFTAIKSEIDKEAASLKRQLQEALASE